MSDLTALRQTINNLYKTTPDIHVNVSISRPKVHIENQAARIVAVYPNFFIIEAEGKQYSVKYLDLFTNSIDIPEVGAEPFLNNITKLHEQGGGHRRK